MHAGHIQAAATTVATAVDILSHCSWNANQGLLLQPQHPKYMINTDKFVQFCVLTLILNTNAREHLA